MIGEDESNLIILQLIIERLSGEKEWWKRERERSINEEACGGMFINTMSVSQMTLRKAAVNLSSSRGGRLIKSA